MLLLFCVHSNTFLWLSVSHYFMACVLLLLWIFFLHVSIRKCTHTDHLIKFINFNWMSAFVYSAAGSVDRHDKWDIKEIEYNGACSHKKYFFFFHHHYLIFFCSNLTFKVVSHTFGDSNDRLFNGQKQNVYLLHHKIKWQRWRPTQTKRISGFWGNKR